ncbi:unnamed protein product [Umbelopsis vinacea]
MKLTSVFAATCALMATFAQAKPTTRGNTGPNGEKYVTGRQFDRMFTITFENNDVWPVQADPWFGNLWKQNNHRLLANFHAITHDSQPNYFDQTAASDFGDNLYNCDFECDPDANVNITMANTKNIVDVLEEAGITWRAYAEDYPIHQGCYLGGTPEANGKSVPHSYVRKHFPFVSFPNIYNNSTRCDNLFNADQFFIDFKNKQLPQYVYFVPNLMNDMHDTNVTYGSKYMQQKFGKIFQDSYFNDNALNIVTFDESGNYTHTDMNNQIYTTIFGSGVQTRSTWDHIDWAFYNHFSLVSTVEDNWLHKTGQLGRNDTTANIISVAKPWTN